MTQNGIGKMADRLNRCIREEPLTNFYEVETVIGRGKFAVVRKIRDKNTGKTFAGKFMRKRRKGKDCRSDILHELVIHEIALSNPQLIHMTEIYETSHEIIIVMEYAAGGELFHHCVVEDTFVERDTVRMMRQILEGIVFLHDRSIVHLDIKPSNILLMKEPRGGAVDVKVCDFGFARLVNTGADIREILGTPDFVAPEILSYEPIHEAADMWSVGVLAYVMLTGHSPFMGETKQETYFNISQVNYDFPDDLFENISSQARDFIQKLLQKEPEERPSARDCLNHPWLHSDDLQVPAPSRSPYGSPLGCRRSVPQVDKEIMEEEVGPSKKYKLNPELNISSLKENQPTAIC